MIKETKRKTFKFYRSYFDMFNELDKDKDKLAFIEAVFNKQFLGIDPDLSGIVKFAYISQLHSIEKQVKGWQDATGQQLTGAYVDPIEGGGIDPKQEEEEQEKEKVKEKEKGDIESIYLLYPSKCVVKQSSTGKSSKVNKEQIKKLFKDYSLKDLTLIIERYINDCKTGNIYMKNFKTFLNNIPDYDLKDINTMQRTEHMTKGYCKMLLKVPAMLQEVLKKGYTVEQINTWSGC